MAGLTNAESAATLDARFPTTGGTDYIWYSANGTSETASLARTSIGATGWAADTVADPSVKSNANALTSAAASGIVTVSHYAVGPGPTGGTQRSDWTAFTNGSKSLAIGDTITWAVGDLDVTLT